MGRDIKEAKMVVRVEAEEEIRGHTYLKTAVVYSGIPGVEPEIVYQRRTPDGLYEVSGRQKEDPVAYPLLLEVGASWEVETPEYKINAIVEAVEDAQLLSKTYEDCVKISFTQEDAAGTANGYYYLAPVLFYV